MIRHLPKSQHRAMPWKNGGGTTWEIATDPDGAGLDDFGWRLSAARVETDGPFSAFPGIDRTLSIIGGAGLTLDFPGRGAVRLNGGSPPFVFRGDAPASARLADGPIVDFNVMTRREVWRHRVQRLTLTAGDVIAPAGDRLAVYVADGDAWISAGPPVTPAVTGPAFRVDLWRL